MRDLYKTIASIEHALTRGLDRKAAPPKEKPKPSIRAWRAPAAATDTRYPTEQIFKKEKSMPSLTVSARALKVTAALDAAAVAALPTPEGQARIKLSISCDGKIYTADIAMKSLRKCKATIAANGVENVFTLLQGKLKGNEIIEAGIVAQVKLTAKGEETKA
jgi:hypothetical protein